MRPGLLLLATAAAALALAGRAEASTLIVGEGFASACYDAADHGRSDQQALDVCDTALREDPLSNRDRAATVINRGIIHIHRREAQAALADFDQAARLAPNLGESFINRGAALIILGDYAGAIEAINQGLELGCQDEHEAYFNRGIAYEQMGDVRAAYGDYQHASELKPDWEQPLIELRRFTVRRTAQQ